MVKKWPYLLEDQLDRKADDGESIQFWWSVRKKTKPTLLSWFPLRPNDPQLKLFADQQYRATHKRTQNQFSGAGGCHNTILIVAKHVHSAFVGLTTYCSLFFHVLCAFVTARTKEGNICEMNIGEKRGLETGEI